MTPTRPYLVRAFYDWILDNGLTPYLLVDASVAGTSVPASHVRDGQIVLNVAPAAVGDLSLGIAETTFSARFGGVACQIRLPSASILAIYARENGQGMFFGAEEEDDGAAGTNEAVAPEPQSGSKSGPVRPALKLVK
ncbi:MAG: ClpXP protease specificity-enhancing factor [Gammaproteobacteria bacterium]